MDLVLVSPSAGECKFGVKFTAQKPTTCSFPHNVAADVRGSHSKRCSRAPFITNAPRRVERRRAPPLKIGLPVRLQLTDLVSLLCSILPHKWSNHQNIACNFFPYRSFDHIVSKRTFIQVRPNLPTDRLALAHSRKMLNSSLAGYLILMVSAN